MKLAYCSDLHLEFSIPEKHRLQSDAPYLILAGDICESRYLNKFANFFQMLSDMYERVIYIAGNHEYYDSRIDKTDNTIREFVSKFPNITFLQNESIVLDGLKIFGATFWTNMGSETDKYFIKQGMNDFKLITYKDGTNYRKFSPYDAAKLHAQSLAALTEAKPDIVIAHHAPTELSIHPHYRNHRLNNAYVSQAFQKHLDDGNQYKAIIHGHIHHHLDYMYAGTRVLANPRGYGHYEQKLVDSWSVDVLEIDL